jgi:hypothetical protein
MSTSLSARVLQISRMKIIKEMSAANPRLLRVLVCANMADMICTQCITEPRPESDRTAFRTASINNRSDTDQVDQWRDAVIRPIPQAATKPLRACSPATILMVQPPLATCPQAPLCDRTVSRKCMDSDASEARKRPALADLEPNDSDSAKPGNSYQAEESDNDTPFNEDD